MSLLFCKNIQSHCCLKLKRMASQSSFGVCLELKLKYLYEKYELAVLEINSSQQPNPWTFCLWLVTVDSARHWQLASLGLSYS